MRTHVPTGWQVDPDTGTVYGIAGRFAGKPIGSNNGAGYLASSQLVPGGRKYWLLHRVVWEACVGSIPEGEEINHLNGRKSDNRLVNLEPGSHRTNTDHAWDTGLCPHPPHTPGTTHGMHKLTDDQVREIECAPGSQRAIAAEYGVSQRTVWRIKTHQGWKHLWMPLPSSGSCGSSSATA